MPWVFEEDEEVKKILETLPYIQGFNRKKVSCVFINALGVQFISCSY